MKVYLAGGMRSGWQDEVKGAVDAEFVDPRHDLESSEDDLRAKADEERRVIETCDLIFAYLEETNTRPIGMWHEMTWAHAHGIPVLFVDGWTEDQRKHMSRDWVPGFLELSGQWRADSLEGGIERLGWVVNI